MVRIGGGVVLISSVCVPSFLQAMKAVLKGC
jgi:hypothetical protein